MSSTVPGHSTVQLRVRDGRAVLVGIDETEFGPERLPLPEKLVTALHEWAAVSYRVSLGENAEAGAQLPAQQTVARRGRQLAAKLATEAGTTIAYVDPISGSHHEVRPQRRRGSSAHRDAHRQATSGEPLTAPEPTPWATGLTVSAAIAAIVTIVLVVVTSGLVEISLLLAVLVNLAVAAGFAPSIWIGRGVTVWRWVSYGVAGGVACAWFALLLSLLG